MAEKWIKIHENSDLHKGDIVKLDFLLMSLFDWDVWYGVQMAGIEDRIAADPRFTLLSTSYPENGLVTFKIRVDENPITVLAIIAIIVTGISIFVVFKGAQQFVKEVSMSAVGIKDVAEQTGTTALQIGFAVFLGVVGFVWLKSV